MSILNCINKIEKNCQFCKIKLTQEKSDYCSWYCRVFIHAKWIFISGLIIYMIHMFFFPNWWIYILGLLLMCASGAHFFSSRYWLNSTHDLACLQCRILLKREEFPNVDSCPVCGCENLHLAYTDCCGIFK